MLAALNTGAHLYSGSRSSSPSSHILHQTFLPVFLLFNLRNVFFRLWGKHSINRYHHCCVTSLTRETCCGADQKPCPVWSVSLEQGPAARCHSWGIYKPTSALFLCPCPVSSIHLFMFLLSRNLLGFPLNELRYGNRLTGGLLFSSRYLRCIGYLCGIDLVK